MDPAHPLRTWHLPASAGPQMPDAGLASPGATSDGSTGLKARVAGLDTEAGRTMSDAEKERLGDWFAINILRRGVLPVTLDDLGIAIDALASSSDPRPHEQVFVIAEAGQIRWSRQTASLPRGIRYVVARGRVGEAGADVLVSTRPPSNSTEAFLQVAAWDATQGHFNFYERIGASWFWEGNSGMALDVPTRGRGPFDSHVNGGLVMKELARPWMHWESTSQTIALDAFPPDHPVVTDRYFARRQPAHLLEVNIVRPGIERWSRARLDRVLDDATGIRAPAHLLRHVLMPTSVNVATSDSRSAASTSSLALPYEFFLDRELLFDILDVPTDIAPVEVARADYDAAVTSLGLHLRSGAFRQNGETFFAWPVPVRAFEDNVIVRELVQRGALSRHLVLALAMVDFTNPLTSASRGGLMSCVPAGPVRVADLDLEISRAIAAAARGAAAGTPLRSCADDLALSEAVLIERALARIEAFWMEVKAKAAQPAGVLDLLRLADSRRREFRRRPLIKEISLTMPVSDEPPGAPFLRLTPAAGVEAIEPSIA